MPLETSKPSRLSISLSTTQYREVSRLASQKRVSVAWVIRDAVEDYLAKHEPLFHQRAE